METSYKFKFSIVMAVYNVEQFLREAIDSVISQDIGFNEYVQLILVDDGSKDSSGAICDEYGKLYPDNIVVIHKENGGVSTARNEGLQYIKGKYVNFLDSDDKLEGSTLRLVGEFFDENYALTDVVSIPIEFFDGQTGSHLLNYKFDKGTRVVDLSIVYNYIQLSLSAAFLKHEDAKNIVFDSALKYAEDAKVCLGILDNKRTLGVLSEARYYYRKRLTGESSAIQKSGTNVDWYTPYLENFTYSIINYYVNKKQSIPWFVQYTLMYDLQWRFKADYMKVVNVLGEKNSEEFLNKLYRTLDYIDDEIILAQRNLYPEYKAFLLKKKYGKDLQLAVDRSGEYALYLNQHLIIKLGRCQTKLEFLSFDRDSVCVELLNTYIGDMSDIPYEQYVKVNESYLKCYPVVERVIPVYCLNELIAYKIGYKGIISLDKFNTNASLSVGIYDKVGLEYIRRTNLAIGKFFPVVKKFRNAYASVNGYIVQIKNNSLIVTKKSVFGRLVKEVKLLKEYITCHGEAGKKAAVARCLYHIIKPFFRKEIWLISDRINKADDNGEALFKYINENRKPVNAYFVLHKDSLDFDSVSQIGKVLQYRSWKHKLYHLLADKWISAAGDEFVSNPFFNIELFYRDILRKKKQVFLQHGITKDDLSNWLNRYNKNLALFITGAIPEYKSIIEGQYFYDEHAVKLTGFSRYDRLIDKSEKIITIMPTWRDYLSNNNSNSSYFDDGVKRYSDDFKKSNFFLFYNGLINNRKLLEAAQKFGYKLRFMPHPNLISYIEWFDKNDMVEFCHIDTKYRNIFSTSQLVVTDYSSVAFDFAYLRKPVIYTQFDKADFFGGHIYTQGYFDYERDGFGEVEYTLDDTVNRLIEYMESNCVLKDKYKKRIDSFFAYNDRNNCERIYNEIINLK